MAREAAATTPHDTAGTKRTALTVAVAWIEYLVLALFAFVPQLASQPGVVDSDTKSYLFIDPARFIAQSASMWDPDIALGTVTHQQLGYLFPMGPFFLATHALGIPVWAAERLWVGATLFAAGAGVVYLAHTLKMRGPGVLAAGAGLHAVAVFLAVRRADLGDPAVVGGPSLARRARGAGAPARRLAVPGPVRARRSHRRWGERELAHLRRRRPARCGSATRFSSAASSTWRRVWGVVWRTGLLTLAVSLWWIVGLEIEGGYGLDILKYTETVQAVSQTSYASEVLRGLGYWYFYGSDRLGQWVATSVQFTQQIWLDRDQLRCARRRIRLGRRRALAASLPTSSC